jgi:plasmid replication initiation protein
MIAISKSIVDAQYSLELNEKNIIYLALAGINQFQTIEVGMEHKVTVADFAYLRGKVCKDSGRIIPIRSEDARSQLEKALIGLFKSSIKLSAFEEHKWIAGYKDLASTDGTYITITWNPDLLPHLANLSNYANLLTSSLAGIKGKYTGRILELVSQTKMNGMTRGSVYLEMEEFLDMIEAKPTYRNYKYLNALILKPAINELYDLKIVSIERVETVKYKRKVKGFTLYYINDIKL